MANVPEMTSMALFCDFENVALGVRDAKYDKFDIKKVLERLLLKGSIVVKKAYCDWDRYKEFKAPMHEASFELIEIPHVRQSGKNSADIRMVVDALDLCYTKSHVDTFVHHQRRLRFFAAGVEAAREQQDGDRCRREEVHLRPADRQLRRIHLLRRSGPRAEEAATRRAAARKRGAKRNRGEEGATTAAEAERSPARGRTGGRAQGRRKKRQEALDFVVETVEAMTNERGAEEKIWGSMVKQALKRRRPGFNETYYGYGSFSKLLEEAARAGCLRLESDEKSGGYRVRLGSSPED